MSTARERVNTRTLLSTHPETVGKAGKSWAIGLLASFVLTVAALMAYGAAQQALRQSANWPQVQMAQDTAAAIAAGKSPGTLVSADPVDIGESLAPFVIVYDADGNVVASSGLLHGSAPKVPQGVLEYAAAHGENRVSWQPEQSLRIAAVLVKIQSGQGGTVLAGRSLAETERTIRSIGQLILALWAGSEVFLLVVGLLLGLVTKKKT